MRPRSVKKRRPATVITFTCDTKPPDLRHRANDCHTLGGETILISDLESEVQQMRMNGASSDRDMRCELLENMMESKLFLMQARVDSLTVNTEMVENNLNQRIDWFRTQLGGDEELEKYFGKPLYKLRQEWHKAMEDQSLTEQERYEIASKISEVTPYDVQKYIDSTEPEDLPRNSPRPPTQRSS